MPWFRTLLLGIAVLLACACGGVPAAVSSTPPSPAPAPVPTPTATPALGGGYAPWALNLDVSGELTGHVTGTAAPDELILDECTGPGSASTGRWALTMAMNLGQQRYALVVLADGYKGAGQFTANVRVELHSPDKARVWQNGPGDAVSFTVGADEQSGLLDATLSSATTTSSKVRVTGHWSCRP